MRQQRGELSRYADVGGEEAAERYGHKAGKTVVTARLRAFAGESPSAKSQGCERSDYLAELEDPGIFGVVQAHASAAGAAEAGALDDAQVRRAAARGVSGSGEALPYLDVIQRAFGPHDVSGARAHFGADASEASEALGAHAFATGDRVAFAEANPSLFLVAHEAAHVVQQRAGVHLSSAMGREGDAYEQHADAVAERVVRGESAADLLGPIGAASGVGGASAGANVLRKGGKDRKESGAPPAIKGARLVVWFGFDSAAPRKDGKVDNAATMQLAQERALALKAKSGLAPVITLHGYASEEGDAAHNDALSAKRAATLQAELIEAGHPHVIVRAHGEDATFDDKEWNRRVEIEIAAQAPGERGLCIDDPEAAGCSDPGAEAPAGSTPSTGYRVFVIGSPGPGEIDAKHPLQFALAAAYQGVDEHTVWILEETGYTLASAYHEQQGTGSEDFLEAARAMGPEGAVIGLRPERSLTAILGGMAPGSIQSLTVYSHGLAGELTLRYGWEDEGAPNYGLDGSEVASLRKTAFAPDATVSFESCNTGSDPVGPWTKILAQQIADQLGLPVEAWTGRTSYTEVNDGADDGDTEVEGSQVARRGVVDWLTIKGVPVPIPTDVRSPDWKELGSRALGRAPERKTFNPGEKGGAAAVREAIAAATSTQAIDAIVSALQAAATTAPDRQGLYRVVLPTVTVAVTQAELETLAAEAEAAQARR